MLQKIKILLQITDNTKDNLLQTLIQNAVDNTLNYCHLDILPETLESCVCQMVVISYNQLGAEGLASESYSGVNYNYLTTYPDTIINQLKSHRRLRIY